MDEKKPDDTLEKFMKAVGLGPLRDPTPEEREHIHKILDEYMDSKQGKGLSQETVEPIPTKERVEQYYGVELTDPSPERLKELRTFWTEWQRKKSKSEE